MKKLSIWRARSLSRIQIDYVQLSNRIWICVMDENR